MQICAAVNGKFVFVLDLEPQERGEHLNKISAPASETTYENESPHGFGDQCRRALFLR